MAALSARVGSIGDNRLGGWVGYRSAKAALNQIIRTLAIELGRTHPQALLVGLHPGTVDTALSEPFQRNVAPGKLFTPDGVGGATCSPCSIASPRPTAADASTMPASGSRPRRRRFWGCG